MFDKIMDWIKSVLNHENPKLDKAKLTTSHDEIALNQEIQLFDQQKEKESKEEKSTENVVKEEKKKYLKQELNKLTKAKLFDLAKNEFDSELDPKLKKADLVGVILKLQE